MSPPGLGSSLVLVVDAGVVLQAGPLLPVVPLDDDGAPEVRGVGLEEEKIERARTYLCTPFLQLDREQTPALKESQVSLALASAEGAVDP